MPLILLIIGFIMIIYSCRAIKRENENNRENDSLNISFQSVLEDSKEELNDYKMEIGILRKDIAESLTELQEEILDIRSNLNMLKNNRKVYENKEDLEKIYSLNGNDIDDKLDVNDFKSNEEVKVENKKLDYLIDDIDETSSINSFLEEEVISEKEPLKKTDSNKTQNIKKLLEEGLTEEEICHKLSVSKGEVLLVKGLFKK